ncbi:MAG: phage Gp37/Gp68 family protein [Armatimonadetes bacterium]|nr:phage Gp37/Gp68 family protein [Armatimonadota bacterium]
MAQDSKIEWTDATWNPVRGCTRVSAGCQNCYAERQAIRQAGPGKPYEGLVRSTSKGPMWTGEIRLAEDKLYDPLQEKKPTVYFVNSMSDLFHEGVPDGYIARVWDVMGKCPGHTFQILTKRPERMRDWVRRWADLTGERIDDVHLVRGPEATRKAHPSGRGQLFAAMLESMGDPPPGCAYPTFDWQEGQRWWPRMLPNVWLGVSAEDQETADARIPLLLETPAAVRFISAEPLLGPVDLNRKQLLCKSWRQGLTIGTYLDWVIVGGESGPGARPCDLAWIRGIVEQCQADEVPVFVKQLGSKPYQVGTAPFVAMHSPLRLKDKKGGVMEEWPEDLQVREFPRVDPKDRHDARAIRPVGSTR